MTVSPIDCIMNPVVYQHSVNTFLHISGKASVSMISSKFPPFIIIGLLIQFFIAVETCPFYHYHDSLIVSSIVCVCTLAHDINFVNAKDFTLKSFLRNSYSIITIMSLHTLNMAHFKVNV